MKTAIISSIRWVTLAVVAGFGSLTHARAQCTAPPSYSPDFSASQSCLTLNGFNTTFTGSPSFTSPQTPQPNVANVLRLTANQGGWASSAWYQTQQTVANGFSTTFAFQIGSTSTYDADGFAFVIQNSSLSALGPGGCGIGFGGSSSCIGGGGITNSLAIEFNTFNNGSGVDPSNNDVAIQSCGVAANTVDDGNASCSLAHNDLNTLSSPIVLASGTLHVATVTYTASTQSTCGPQSNQTCSTIDVVLDGVDLFPGGVFFDLHSIGLSGSGAWVGFTAATGGGNDDQDIVNWTFTPQGQSQSGTVNPGQATPTTFNINGGFVEGSPTSGYTFTAQETTSNQQLQMVVSAIPTSQQACNAMVQQTFAGAHCFVYQNGGGQGQDSAVLFEVTCPPNGSCGSTANPFNGQLGTQFNFDCSENVPLQCPPAGTSFGFPNLTSVNNLPEVGWLKGEGPDAFHPCTPNTNGAALFQSNQIQSFSLGDTSGGAKGSSGGTTSCWVLTYLTPGELPTISISQPAPGAYYQQGSITAANFACNPVNAGASSPVGPYLTLSTDPTVSACSATDTPGGSVANGAQFDTATLGPHTFTVQVQDSATNTNQQSISYTVVTGSAPASGTKCNGVYYGTFKGNITVAKGQSCTFVAGGVTGSITVLGGSLSLTNATVGGGVGIAGGTYSIGSGTIIKGNVAIAATPVAAQPNQVCGSSIAGNLSFAANAGAVSIGSSSQSCPGNTIGGNLIVDLNVAPTAIFGNSVGGNLLDQANLKPTQVFNNHIKGNLTCQADTSITGGGNIATKKQGQCASF